MKKVLFTLCFIFSLYFTVSAQYIYSSTSIVNGRIYSTSGWVNITGGSLDRLHAYAIENAPTWNWDIEKKIKKEDFNLQITDSTISFLGQTYEYGGKMDIDIPGTPLTKKRTNYIYHTKDRGSIFIDKNTVMIVGDAKEIYYLK